MVQRSQWTFDAGYCQRFTGALHRAFFFPGRITSQQLRVIPRTISGGCRYRFGHAYWGRLLQTLITDTTRFADGARFINHVPSQLLAVDSATSLSYSS
jgi:hypothetical protein